MDDLRRRLLICRHALFLICLHSRSDDGFVVGVKDKQVVANRETHDKTQATEQQG